VPAQGMLYSLQALGSVRAQGAGMLPGFTQFHTVRWIQLDMYTFSLKKKKI